MNDISDFQLFDYKYKISVLAARAEEEIHIEPERILLDVLDEILSLAVFLKNKSCFPEIHRITINKNILGSNKRINDTRQLKYPPADLVKKYGRCNLPNQSIFYGSFIKLISTKEMQPEYGDLITTTTWRAKNDGSLTYTPIFFNQPTNIPQIHPKTGELIKIMNPRTMELKWKYDDHTEDLPANRKIASDSAMQFITDCFSKFINNGNHLNYFYSGYIANKLFNDMEDGKIDAILYPSVQDRLNSENIAIKHDVFDKIYEIVEADESVLTTDPRFGGGFGFQGLSHTKEFNLAGSEVLWQPLENNDRNKTLIKRFNLDLK